MKSSRPRPAAGGRPALARQFVAAAAVGLFLSLSPGPARADRDAAPSRLTARQVVPAGTAASEPGSVVLELIPSLPDDPENSARLQAVLLGPLEGDRADDLYAFSVGIRFAPDKMVYLPSSLRKGDLLERDGRTSLITGGVTPNERARLTIGASRLGAVPGIAAPAGRTTLFSVAFGLLAPGEAALEWQDASFIDSSVKPVDAARFVAAVLTLAPEED